MRRLWSMIFLACMALVACRPSAPPNPPSSPSSQTGVPSGPAGVASPSPAVTAAGVPRPAQVPAGFGVLSTTWISERVGWALGVVSCSGGRCLSLAQTGDGGATWVPRPAPPVPPATGTDALAAQKVRFANLNDGWVFGPGLWATHDGGIHWARVTLPGASGAEVSSLEAASGRVHAALLDGPMLRIESSPVGSEGWQLSPLELSVGAGPVPSAQLVLQGDAGWLVEVNRVVVGGARLQGGRWTAWDPPCLDGGGPAVLASSNPSELVAVCNEGLWTGPEVAIHAYESADEGSAFRRLPSPLPKGSDRDVGRPGPRTIVVAGATDSGTPTIVATFDDGATWRTVWRGSSRRMLRELGFTSAVQGVAVETSSDGLGGRVLMTHDGGRTWARLRLGS